MVTTGLGCPWRGRAEAESSGCRRPWRRLAGSVGRRRQERLLWRQLEVAQRNHRRAAGRRTSLTPPASVVEGTAQPPMKSPDCRNHSCAERPRGSRSTCEPFSSTMRPGCDGIPLRDAATARGGSWWQRVRRLRRGGRCRDGSLPSCRPGRGLLVADPTGAPKVDGHLGRIVSLRAVIGAVHRGRRGVPGRCRTRGRDDSRGWRSGVMSMTTSWVG